MTAVLTLFSSVIISFLSHDLGERFLTRAGRRQVRLIIGGFQIHHSSWALVIAAIGLIFTSGYLTLIMLGYGIGNLWQHKLAHNRVNEPGMVFISRIS